MENELIILTYPEPFLLQPTTPVENVDGVLQETIERMGAIMYEAPGVGLAAIQVGLNQSFLVYDVVHSSGEGRQLEVLVNPRIVEMEGSVVSEQEGCLSVPDFRSDVKRAERILVEGFDRDGEPLRFEADGFKAVVLQHEIDHLNGRLFIDRISRLKRQIYKRKRQKQLRQQDE